MGALRVFLQLPAGGERTARLQPPVAVRCANLALAQGHLGFVADAEASYRRAVALAPDDPQSWNDFGLLLRGHRGLAAALPMFARSRAVESPPGTGPAIINLVQSAIERPDTRTPDLVTDASAALARRPDATMLRRLLLDLLLSPPATAATEQPPDKGAPRR